MADQIPAECSGIQKNIDNLNADLAELQRELRSEPDLNKVLLQNGIAKLTLQIDAAQQQLDDCIGSHTPPPPPPPPPIPAECLFIQTNIDNINADLQEALFEAAHDPDINQALLAKGIAKLDAQLLAAKEALEACINNPPPVPPTIPKPVISSDTTKTPLQKIIPWALVKRKMDDFFNKRTDPQIFTIRFNHHDHFDSDGNLDNNPPASDVTVSMIEAEVVNGQVTTTYNQIVNMDLGQLSDDFYFNDVNSSFISVAINPTDPTPLTIQVDFETEGTEVKNTSILGDIDFLIFNFSIKLSFDQVGLTLDFLSWLDKVANLTDDDLDSALGQYVPVHITSSGPTDFGGAFQKRMRLKLYGALKDNRTKLNLEIMRWILGGKGLYDVTSLVKDAQNITINYQVPANELDPFPDSMIRPEGWPYHGNTKPTISLPVRGNLISIKNIVVLTMENRSFDHMLGYLSLPLSAGGMGRTDVDGLKGNETNSFDSITSQTFPFAMGDTAFPFDPAHSYEPVFRQINATLDGSGNAIPGTGKMDGFVKSAEIDKLTGGAAALIMGHQPAANVPVYDALARDFAISHRWFASHPGPTFCNRFYELTGRLNLDNGLGDATKEGFWEYSNSSPLTPVFNETIFDHLSDYRTNFDSTVTWKYYEHDYCFLRFFTKYTFDNQNVVRIDDPDNGFFADAKRGALPTVSYIDPQFIELPPRSNCDGPVADIKAGQDLVRRVVEAVVTSPQFDETLLIITYDEHGGFYDHVPPPAATPFSPDMVIKSTGVRVPAFFISPWVKAGAVYGHDVDASGDSLYFDHTSILKTIAARFLGKNPPYMGPRFANAKDLSNVLLSSLRKPQFLPFIRYNLDFIGSDFRMTVQNGGTTPGTPLIQQIPLNTIEQDFSFEPFSTWVIIRAHSGNLYLTVDLPAGGTIPQPVGTIGVRTDIIYTSSASAIKLQQQIWTVTPFDPTGVDKTTFVISSGLFPNKILQGSTGQGGRLTLVDKPATLTSSNAWVITSPALK